jgi:hypothetical protein
MTRWLHGTQSKSEITPEIETLIASLGPQTVGLANRPAPLAGILGIGLGFWTSWQALLTQTATLLVLAGIWALLHGITDFIKAFQIKRLGSLPAANMTLA